MSRIRKAASAISTSLRPRAGSLVLVLLVGLFFQGAWNLELTPLTSGAVRLHIPKAGQDPNLWSKAPPLVRQPEGAYWAKGLTLKSSHLLEVTLPPLPARAVLRIQADSNDIYVVMAMGGGKKLKEVWSAGPVPGIRGLATRSSGPMALPPGGTVLRVRPHGGDGNYAISSLSVTPVLSFRLLHLAGLLWLAWGLLAALGAWRVTRRPAAILLRGWAALDSPAAITLCLFAIFKVTAFSLCLWVALGLLWLCSLVLRRSLARAALLGVTLVGLYFLVITPVVKSVVKGQVQRLQVLDLEHRLKPFAEPDINSDGLRFRGEAKDLKAEEFNILFMGDSFTYGWRLTYEQTYPLQLEKILAGRGCSSRVRAVNLGWPGASPTVGLRLLKQIGEKYKPDLVLYNLDMTDFRDDLMSDKKLQEQGMGLEPRVPSLIWHAARYAYIKATGESARFDQLKQGLRPRRAADRDADQVPQERFFPLLYPLEQTRAKMERGTMRHLKRIQAHCRSSLKVPMAMVILPRACQYSATEAPRNWEHDCPVKGEHVKEPNRYLRQVKQSLGYPSIDLLPLFEASETFPLYLEDDPHWNEAGARLTATLVADFLISQKLVPCRVAE